MAITNINKEADKMQAAGTKAVNKRNRLRAAVQTEMKKPGAKEALLNHIFGGNPDSVSPLDEVRKAAN